MSSSPSGGGGVKLDEAVLNSFTTLRNYTREKRINFLGQCMKKATHQFIDVVGFLNDDKQ